MNLYDDGLPAWHRFELVVRNALRPLLPEGDDAGILMNRRLGHECAAEADLLFAGTCEGRSIAVIVECKNRPIQVAGSAIVLPTSEGETRPNLMAQLDLKAEHARTFLEFEDVRFLVVGCTSSPFSVRVTSSIFAVGQPIGKWVSPTIEQDFSPLTSAWTKVVMGVKALHRDCARYIRLSELPRFTPWLTAEAAELQEDLRAERLDCEMDYLRREAAGDREEGRFHGVD